MQYTLQPLTNPTTHTTECLVVPIFHQKLSEAARAIDQASGHVLSALIKRGDIKGEVGETLLLPTPLPHIKAKRVLLLGSGDADTPLKTMEFNQLLYALLQPLAATHIKEACLCIHELSVADRDTAWIIKQLVLTLASHAYRYRKTLSEPIPVSALKKIRLACPADQSLRDACQQAQAVAQGMNAARELGNLPGNICTPTYLAQHAKALSRRYTSLSTAVLDEKKLRELGMHALLAVSAGSEQPAKLIVIKYRGTTASHPPHVLVGKGITFDSGGISLKPGPKMDEMKSDMCGAASVIGTLIAVAELALPINVVGIIAAAENLPDGRAVKPGDVVTSMSGQTIEILNTDAEGRLVLCDALTYAKQHFKPQSIIDIATLTGACVVALGNHASGLFSADDALAGQLITAGEHIHDRTWRLPLWDDYQEQLKSPFADIANIGSGPGAGSITAACFLARFTEGMRWAHLDIAGAARQSGDNKGTTGRPVGLLTQYLINCCT